MMVESHAQYVALIWLGIALCAVQAALFSGLNLAVFSISRLRLEVQPRCGRKPIGIAPSW